MVQEFNSNFVAIHKTTKCSGLLNCDLKTQEGQVQFHEKNLLEKVCEKCITDAIDILEDMMNRI